MERNTLQAEGNASAKTQVTGKTRVYFKHRALEARGREVWKGRLGPVGGGL